jgi:hypothetical protein
MLYMYIAYNYQTTRRYIPEYNNLCTNSHSVEKALKPLLQEKSSRTKTLVKFELKELNK